MLHECLYIALNNPYSPALDIVWDKILSELRNLKSLYIGNISSMISWILSELRILKSLYIGNSFSNSQSNRRKKKFDMLETYIYNADENVWEIDEKAYSASWNDNYYQLSIKMYKNNYIIARLHLKLSFVKWFLVIEDSFIWYKIGTVQITDFKDID